uniref:Uncharacterized protein n=1 Tax=Cryptomonas curvata TaxID=233186 RepID=A0A7S0QLV8_9CRYP|mmetsp:Transcript_50651/g.105816  ORF Transcript_50651/g.105816 Transcript_50651/m.105816 type:complete len:124 (+) Transcript_50651:38-409(+)
MQQHQPSTIEHPSFQLNKADCTENISPSRQSMRPDLSTITGPTSNCFLPPPNNLDRKAKRSSKSPSLLSIEIQEKQANPTLACIYRAQREYVRSLIEQDDVPVKNSSPSFDAWSVCDSIFSVK